MIVFAIGLPGSQSELFTAVLAATMAAKQKLVVVLINGGTHTETHTERARARVREKEPVLCLAVLRCAVSSFMCVVCVGAAGPISIDEIKGTGAAVLAAGFPGQAGGAAIAETLFGINNPGGKLTTTIYPSSYANGEPMRGTPWMDASLRPHGTTNLGTSEGRTHMFYTGTPLFSFGAETPFAPCSVWKT